jgi:hypothetical protein
VAAALAGLGAVALWPGDGREGTQRPPTNGLPPLYPAGTEGAPTPEAAALGFAGVLGMPAEVVGVRCGRPRWCGWWPSRRPTRRS